MEHSCAFTYTTGTIVEQGTTSTCLCIIIIPIIIPITFLSPGNETGQVRALWKDKVTIDPSMYSSFLITLVMALPLWSPPSSPSSPSSISPFNPGKFWQTVRFVRVLDEGNGV